MVDWQGFDLVAEDWNKLTVALAKTLDPSKAVIECAYDNETCVPTFILLFKRDLFLLVISGNFCVSDLIKIDLITLLLCNILYLS